MTSPTPPKKSLVEITSEQIIAYIISHNLQSGERIKNEFELAAELGVGRGTVREAVKTLVSKNILEIRHGAGTFLSNKRGLADDPLGLAFIQDKVKLALDLLSVRLMIEPEITSTAARHATPQQITAIQTQCTLIETLIADHADHTAADIEFHTLIAKSSGNMIVEKLVPIINSSIAASIDMTKRQLKQETIDTHREITQAIARRDAEGAKYAAMIHLAYNRRFIINSVYDSQTI